MSEIIKEKVILDIEYQKERADVKSGVFEGGVDEPETLSDVTLWVDELTEFDFDKDDFKRIGDQINLAGTSSALFELGKYLIALSRYKTIDPDFHVHLEDFGVASGEDRCELLIRKLPDEK